MSHKQTKINVLSVMFIIFQFSDQSLSHNPCTYNQHWLITMTILKHARAAVYQQIFLEPQDVNVKEQSCNKNVFTREIKLKLTPLNKISLRKNYCYSKDFVVYVKNVNCGTFKHRVRLVHHRLYYLCVSLGQQPKYN